MTVTELIDAMRVRLTEIVEQEGYQEMADGFDQAIQMVVDWGAATPPATSDGK